MRTLALFLGVGLAVSAFGQSVPQLLNYQGRVEVQGTNFTGTGNFKFALVNAAGTTNLWSNDGTPVGEPAGSVALTVNNGLYAVLLGSTAPVPPAIFTNQSVFLRVWFNDGSHGSQQLAPDQQLVSVGYAMNADRAGTAAPTNTLRYTTSGGTNATMTMTAGATTITNQWTLGNLGDFNVWFVGSESFQFGSGTKSTVSYSLASPPLVQIVAGGSTLLVPFLRFTEATAQQNLSWYLFADNRSSTTQQHFRISSKPTHGAGLVILDNTASSQSAIWGWQHAAPANFGAGLVLQSSNQFLVSSAYPPERHEDYVRLQNYATADLGGVTIGSNYTAFIVGRGAGIGTPDREFPTNRWAGFVFGPLGTPQSNQVFVALRDQTNGLWVLGISTNGVLGAYRTNNLAVPVVTY